MFYSQTKFSKTLLPCALALVLGSCDGGGSSSGGGGVSPFAGLDNFDFVLDDGFSNTVDPSLSEFIDGSFQRSITPLNSIDNIFDGEQVPVTYQRCGFPNAFYLPSERAIVLCHEFAQFGHDTFLVEYENLGTLTQEEAETQTTIATYDMMNFVMYHEMGHAFDDIREDVPIGGNFESVADAIGVVLSVQTGQPDSAVFGGWFFYFLGGESSLLDEHGSNIDRAGDILCWVIGGSPEVSDDLQSWVNAFNEEGRDCASEYSSQHQFVESLIPGLDEIQQVSSPTGRSGQQVKFDYAFINWLADVYMQRR